MHIAKAAGRLATPDELSAGIDFQRITAKAPARQFHADIIDGGLLGKLIRDPGRRESSIILPLRQLVVVEALGSMFRIVASLSRNNRDTTSLFSIGRCRWRLASIQTTLEGQSGLIASSNHHLAAESDIGWFQSFGRGR